MENEEFFRALHILKKSEGDTGEYKIFDEGKLLRTAREEENKVSLCKILEFFIFPHR